MKRVVNILFVIVMIASMFAGCDQKIVITTGFKEGELVKMSGQIVELDEALILILGSKASYDKGLNEEFWTIEYDGKSMTEYLLEKVKEELININMLAMFAESKNISLSKEEQNNIKTAVEIYMSSTDEKIRNNYDIDYDQVKNLMEKIVLSQKVYDEIVNDYNVEISDEEARVMYVNYIYMDADNEKAKDIANEILNKVNSGNDLKTVSESYDYASYAEEYISRNDFEKETSDVIFKLKTSEVSSILEEDGRLYIIKCINHYDETMTNANKNILIEDKKTEEFNKEYVPFEKGIDVEFNSELWETIDLSKAKPNKWISIYDALKEAEQH